MGLSERTKREMEAGRAELFRQSTGRLPTPEEMVEMGRLIAAFERRNTLMKAVEAGKVQVALDDSGIRRIRPGAAYYVGEHRFVDENPAEFPSEDFLCQLALAYEFGQ